MRWGGEGGQVTTNVHALYERTHAPGFRWLYESLRRCGCLRWGVVGVPWSAAHGKAWIASFIAMTASMSLRAKRGNLEAINAEGVPCY